MVSILISEKELDALKGYIKKSGLKKVPVKSEYEVLRVKDGKVSIVVYNSGKLVHNDSLESMKIMDKILEKEKYDYILGTDEAGKGEWYGPLVIECVAITPEEMRYLRLMGVRDSKTISRTRLLEIAGEIIKLKFARKPLILMPETYNKKYAEFQKEGKTLNDMLAWAHSRAIKDMTQKLEYEKLKVIIDKFDADKTDLRLRNLDKKNIEIVQKIKAESETPVAVASILAKYVFEKKVDELNNKFNIDLRKSKPEDINRDILPFVAKNHFKNVKKLLR